jgi:hypothetical protein
LLNLDALHRRRRGLIIRKSTICGYGGNAIVHHPFAIDQTAARKQINRPLKRFTRQCLIRTGVDEATACAGETADLNNT